MGGTRARRDMRGPTTIPHRLMPLWYHSTWAFLCAGPSCMIDRFWLLRPYILRACFLVPEKGVPAHSLYPCFVVASILADCRREGGLNHNAQRPLSGGSFWLNALGCVCCGGVPPGCWQRHVPAACCSWSVSLCPQAGLLWTRRGVFWVTS